MKRTAFVPTGDIYADYINTNRKYSMNTQQYHETFEIYLQLEGTRYIFCDDICYNMKRGDMMVIAPFDVHYARQGEGESYERMVLNFNPDAMKCILSEDDIYTLTRKIKSGIIHLDDEQTEIFKTMFMRIRCYIDNDIFLKEKVIYAALLQFVVSVVELSGYTEVESNARMSNHILDVIRYVNKNYTEDITVDSLAKIAHMSKHYFCKKFKSTTGATAMEFLDNVRLTKVHHLLVSSEFNMDQIAEKTGFSSALNMLRAFKKVYGMPPTEFRKKHIK